MVTKTTVMIVEDDLALAQIHHRYLEQMEGFDVIALATNEQEALMQLDVLEPQLLILDVYLPDGSGLNILRHLRQHQQGCDVILITAARDVDTLQEAMRGGVVDYLLKPVMFPRLQEALDKYQRRHQRLDSASGLDQHLVDELFQPADKLQGRESRLPKGIDSVTLEKIRGLFSQSMVLTADEAGGHIGASRTTARRYLEYLITTGELAVDAVYGSVGRPERTYRKIIK